MYFMYEAQKANQRKERFTEKVSEEFNKTYGDFRMVWAFF